MAKTIWIEVRDHVIKGEALLLKALRGLNGVYRAELTAETKRTNQQNKYMHVLFTLLRKGLYYAGYNDITTMERAKDFFKDEYLAYEAVNPSTGRKYLVKRGTSELSKDEGAEFIDKVIMFAAEELGMYIPTKEEFEANPAKWSLSALAV